MSKKMKPVVVTTELKGVFFGYVPEGAKTGSDQIKLTNVRMCVYWSSDVRGVLGLAANGPTHSCRITPAAPSTLLTKVSSVMDASEAAAKAWEAGPWA